MTDQGGRWLAIYQPPGMMQKRSLPLNPTWCRWYGVLFVAEQLR